MIKKIQNTIPNFFGPVIRLSLLVIVFFEILSYLTHSLGYVVDLNSLFFIIITLIVFALSLYKLEWGIFIAIMELFIGSKGHLFALDVAGITLSVRIGIFAAIMLAWLIYLIRKNQFSVIKNILQTRKELVLLGIVCLWGIIFAFVQKNNLSNIFLDFNAWLYFLYIFPFLTIIKTKAQLNTIIQLLVSACVFISLKSLFFLYTLSHNLSFTRQLYLWGRDTGWGEFTLVQGNLFRIFSQAQIFILIALFIFIGFLFLKGRLNYRLAHNQYLGIIVFFGLAALILSMSRSYWVGLIVGTILLLILAIFVIKVKFKTLIPAFFRLLFIGILSYAMIITIISFPWPEVSNIADGGSIFSERFKSGAAVSSRWSQLPNLTQEIIKHPVIGSGWGSTVTYLSQDPRILTVDNPTGEYTTFAFEWGYLDMMLKIGFVGVVIYLAMLWILFKKLWLLYKKNTDRIMRALIAGLAMALLALMAVHGFSPYLNHPLGIGFVLLIYVFISVLSTQPNIAPKKS